MKKLLIFVFFLIFQSCFSQENRDKSYFPDLIATWLSQNKKQKIKIGYDSVSKVYTGIIEWMYEDDHTQGRSMLDSKNPNPSLRSRRVTGIQLLYRIKYSGNDKFKGMVYDPISGKEYKCILTLMPDRKTAEIRAYILVPMIGRTDIATKVIN